MRSTLQFERGTAGRESPDHRNNVGEASFQRQDVNGLRRICGGAVSAAHCPEIMPFAPYVNVRIFSLTFTWC